MIFFFNGKIFPGLTQPWIPDYLLESRIFFLKLFVTYFQKLEVWIGIHLLFLTTFKNGPKLRENLLKTSPSNHFLKICSSKILLFCYVVSPRRIIIPFKYEKDEAFLKKMQTKSAVMKCLSPSRTYSRPWKLSNFTKDETLKAFLKIAAKI